MRGVVRGPTDPPPWTDAPAINTWRQRPPGAGTSSAPALSGRLDDRPSRKNEVPMYPNLELHIGGAWRGASGGGSPPATTPGPREPIGTPPVATREDLDAALEAAKRGFKAWKATSVYDRYKIMRKAADLLRERAETIAKIMTLEPTAPPPGARLGGRRAPDPHDWSAEEGPPAYGRVTPGRAEGVMQIAIREP